MRPAPPVAATLARLAAAMHHAQRAPACARVPLRCAHTRAQVDVVSMVLNIHMAHNSKKLAIMCVAPHGLHFERCRAAAGDKDTLHVYRPEHRSAGRCSQHQLPGAPITVKNCSHASEFPSWILLYM